MRVWLMVTAMVLVVAAVIVACGGGSEVPVQAPSEAATLCRQAQAEVEDLELQIKRLTGRACQMNFTCRQGSEGKLKIAEAHLEQALRDVSEFCH